MSTQCPRCHASLCQTLPVSYYSTTADLGGSESWAYRCLTCGYWTDAVMEANRINPPQVLPDNPLTEHMPIMMQVMTRQDEVR